VETAPVARSAARGVLSLTVGKVATYGMQFLVFALLAAHLGPKGLGIFTFGVAAAQVFGVLTNLGFRQVVTREVAQDRSSEAWLVPNYLYLRVAMGLIAYLVLVAALSVAGYGRDQREAAVIAGVLLVLGALGAFSPSVEVRLRMGWLAIADILEALVLLLATVVLVQADASVLPFLWALVVANLVNYLVITVAALRLTNYSWRLQAGRWWPLARVAAPLGLASIFMMIYYQVDITILARLRPDAEVGQYGAAYRVLNISIMLPAMAMMVFSPIFARSYVEGPTILQRRYATAVHLLTLLAVPTALVGAMAAWRVLPLLPGFGEFGRGGIALSILAPAAAAIFVAIVVQGALVAGHLQQALLRIAATGALLNLLLNLALIPVFGLYAAAATTAGTEALVLVLSLRSARGRLGLRWPSHRLLATAAAGVLMAAALVVGLMLHPVLQVALGLVVYALAALPTGAFKWSDLGGILPEGDVTADIGVAPLDPTDIPEGEAVSRQGVRRTWRRLRGANRCRFHSRGSVPIRLLLAARAAGCSEVLIVVHGPPRRGPLVAVGDAVRRLVADDHVEPGA
jgi:O-antigen/teichoic acid export membrane protein